MKLYESKDWFIKNHTKLFINQSLLRSNILNPWITSVKGENEDYFFQKAIQNFEFILPYISRFLDFWKVYMPWLQTDQGALLSKVRRDYRLKSLPNDDLSNYFWHGAHTQLETSTEQKETTTVMSLFLYN